MTLKTNGSSAMDLLRTQVATLDRPLDRWHYAAVGVSLLAFVLFVLFLLVSKFFVVPAIVVTGISVAAWYVVVQDELP